MLMKFDKSFIIFMVERPSHKQSLTLHYYVTKKYVFEYFYTFHVNYAVMSGKVN